MKRRQASATHSVEMLPGQEPDVLRDLLDPAHADDARPVGKPTGGAGQLRARLVATDAVAASAGWLLGLIVPGILMHEPTNMLLGNARWSIVGAVLTLGFLRAQNLYRARNCVIRAVEIQGLMRACALGGLGVFFLAQTFERNVSFERMIIASCVTLALLAAGRSGYRSWLRAGRRIGRHTRPMLLVGANDEAAEFYRLIEDHPESGYRILGILSTDGRDGDIPVPVVGRPADAVSAVARVGATGVIVVASALPSAQLNPLVRRLLDARLHVHVASGLRGIAHHRVRAIPLAHEPLLYLEAATLSRAQLVSKRVLDVFGAAVGMAVSLPVLALAAAAIWLEDRGPILFRQERVGLHGSRFPVYKLRTMVVDAERRMGDLAGLNEREAGPLFKVERDPRVTFVGRVLRATSIDELPQLFNVIQGTMSLVGPRPALPHEDEQFDSELRTRTQVRPGITGLWQVEARDNPAFRLYRRLDLFYVENWSIGLDLSILIATVGAVLGRALNILRTKSDLAAPQPHEPCAPSRSRPLAAAATPAE